MHVLEFFFEEFRLLTFLVVVAKSLSAKQLVFVQLFIGLNTTTECFAAQRRSADSRLSTDVDRTIGRYAGT